MELTMPTLNSSTRKWIWFAVIIMAYVSSMFERSSFSSILKEMSNDLCENGCTKKQLGFIKAFYYIIVLVTSPLFGYLGDRVNRKYLMIGGLCIWGGFGLIMTFMSDYWPFVIINGLSAVGMTVVNSLGRIILADIFEEKVLTKIYSIYSLGVPCGLGLGMLIPNALLEATGDFRIALRLTPGISLLCAIVIFFTLSDPPRGGSEEEEQEQEPPASCWSDFKYIVTNIPFILQVGSVVCRTFAGSTLIFWLPQIYKQAIIDYNLIHGDGASPIEESDVGYIIGILMVVGGVLGIILGSTLSSYFRHWWQVPNLTDTLLVGISTLLTLPLICTSAFVADQSIIASFVLYGFFFTLANIFMSIGTSISMKLIEPTKRSFGFSLQKTINGAIGSASSPVITGILIDWISDQTKPQDNELEAIQLAFIPSYALLGIAGVLYTLITVFLPKEKTDIESEYPNVENLNQAEEGKISVKRNSAAETAGKPSSIHE